MKAKKSFGQNWLRDEYTLDKIVDSADIKITDNILEIGPGMGDLTKKLLNTGAQVFAVEADRDLLPHLKEKFKASSNFHIELQDILKYNLTSLPPQYKVVANIPYYLTSNLIRLLLESNNPPSLMILLIQKEVAERIVAKPGKMSLLSFSVQYYAKAEIVMDVRKELFDPIPKVESAVIKITHNNEALFDADNKKLFRLVKAGFGEKRKTLRNSLSGGLEISTGSVELLLGKSGINPMSRAQELSMIDWQNLYNNAIELDLL